MRRIRWARAILSNVRISGPGHVLFAIAALSLAVLNATYADFAPVWHAVPSGMPGRMLLVYASAGVLLTAGLGICVSRTALPSALAIGAYLAFWAAASIPAIFSHPSSGGSWYGFCEAASSLAGTGILYALLRWPTPGEEMPIAIRRSIRAAQALFGLTCVFYGWSHFAFDDYTASMVPGWLAARLALAYLTGLGHIAAGIALILGLYARLGATLEAIMMSLFGLMVWVPTLWTQPRPKWAGTPQNQSSEFVVTLLLAAAAWVVADALRNRRANQPMKP